MNQLAGHASSVTTPRFKRRPEAHLRTALLRRLAEAGGVRSVGSKGDPFDNAVAETVHWLYKTELISRRGPWRGAEQVEMATAEWVDWWNQRRLHGAADNLPPAEYERRWRERALEVA